MGSRDVRHQYLVAANSISKVCRVGVRKDCILTIFLLRIILMEQWYMVKSSITNDMLLTDSLTGQQLRSISLKLKRVSDELKHKKIYQNHQQQWLSSTCNNFFYVNNYQLQTGAVYTSNRVHFRYCSNEEWYHLNETRIQVLWNLQLDGYEELILVSNIKYHIYCSNPSRRTSALSV